MQIKFLTINIWHGGIVWDNLIEFIDKEKPDVLAIQEAYNSDDQSLEKRFATINEFKKEFPFLPNVAFGETVIDTGHGNAPWGNAIFSRFPINSSRTIFYGQSLQKYDFTKNSDPSLASHGMLEAEISIDGKKVFIYSWHGVWDNHGWDTENRKLMSRVIIQNIQDKEYVILAGDSNIEDDTDTIRGIEKYLINVFRGELISTFNMRHKDNNAFETASVDKVMISKNIKIVEKSQPLVDVSDHYPLKTILEF